MEVKDLSAGQGARYRRRSLQHVIPASVRPHLPGVPLLLSCLVGLEILEDPAGGKEFGEVPFQGVSAAVRARSKGATLGLRSSPSPGPAASTLNDMAQ